MLSHLVRLPDMEMQSVSLLCLRYPEMWLICTPWVLAGRFTGTDIVTFAERLLQRWMERIRLLERELKRRREPVRRW
jgi:hypothetical protein